MFRHLFVSLCASLLTCTLIACGPEATPRQFGTLSMALSATSDSGVHYRLRGGTLVLSGASYATIDLDAAYVDDALISVRIATGQYELGLKEGWYLERDMGQGYAPVDAELVSANPQFMSVHEGETSLVHLNFQAGADALTLATGGLDIDLNVKPECQEGEWVARSCGPGFQGRQVASCESGVWSDFGDCELVSMSSEPETSSTVDSQNDDDGPEEKKADDESSADTQPAVEAEDESPTSAPAAAAQEEACPGDATLLEKHSDFTFEAIVSPENATDFYAYGGANAKGPVSAYTHALRTSVMLHQSEEGTHSLVIVHGEVSDDNAPGSIGFRVVEHQGIRLSAWDGESGDRLNMAEGEFKWEWDACCTDGVALELHAETTCVTMHFVQGEGIEGVDIIANAEGERMPVELPYDPFTICLPTPCELDGSDAPLSDADPEAGASDELEVEEDERHAGSKESAAAEVAEEGRAQRAGAPTVEEPMPSPSPVRSDEQHIAEVAKDAASDTPRRDEAVERDMENPDEISEDDARRGDALRRDQESQEVEGEEIEVAEDAETEELEDAETEELEDAETEEESAGPAPIIALLTSEDAYQEESADFERFVEDFEHFADGAEVARAKSGFIEGDGFFHADKVTFNSWAASQLTQNAEPGEPVADGVQVAGDSSKWQNGLEYYDCAWEGGDAAILGTSAPNKTSGYEGIQANFSSPVRSVIFDLSLNRFGFHVDVFVEGEGDTPYESFRVEGMEGDVIGAHVTNEDAAGITAIRITPMEHGLGGYGVWWWSVWSVSFAM